MSYPGYPPAGGAGYPGAAPGYPGAAPGYPPAGQPGYPAAGAPGYPPAAGYPPAGGGYPAAGYPTGAAPPPSTGFPPAGAPGYPPEPGFPSYPSYPSQPPLGGPPPGSVPGFPAAQPGYPQPPAAGYPGQQPPAAGYPGQPPAAGYPGQPPAAGYPGQPPAAGYPGQQPPAAGYPGQQPPAAGYPGQQAYGQPPAAGYPGAAPAAAYAAGAAPGYAAQPPAAPNTQQLYGAPGAAPAAPVAVAAAAAVEKPRPKAPPAVAEPVSAQLQKLSLTKQPFETHGTVKPAHPFDAEQDCEALRKAMRGMGTNEQEIIDLIVKRSNVQRQQIKLQFKTMYGKDLIKDLKSELSGNLEGIILALFEPSTLYDAKSIRRSIEGAGTDEEALIEILCTRTNEEIKAINAEYTNHYKRNMEKDIISDTSGHFKRLLVSMCQGNRDESSTVDMAKAQKEANDLFQAGEKKWGTDESRFNIILATRNFAQLRATFDEYVRISQRDIMNSVEREFSGFIQQGFKTVIQCVRSRPHYFADRLWRSMKGAGTDDDTLIRVVVSRSEIDLVEIKAAFLEMHHKTLSKMIEGDTSGDFKKLLVAIVGLH